MPDKDFSGVFSNDAGQRFMPFSVMNGLSLDHTEPASFLKGD